MPPAAAEPHSDVLVLEPTSPWRPIDLKEVWRYRELLYFFVWRDVKVRYKQTTLGVLWAILQPLFGMVIFAFVFGRVARLPSDGLPYALFAYAGLLPWAFFANAVTSGGMSVVTSAHLLSKIYFPRVLTPLAAVTTGIFDFAVAALMLVPLMFLYRTAPAATALLWIPVVVLVEILLAFGFAIWLSALVANHRDLRHVITFVVQVWLFATPVVYPLSMMPPKLRWIVALNPMTGVVEAFRRSLFGRPVEPLPLLWAALLAIVLIITGSIYFRRMERVVADVL
jgi:lipopolysaccharide transport system permease protein